LRKAPVDGAHADACAPRNLVVPDLQAIFGERLSGGVEHKLPVSDRVAA
jgi:hypothetical protein